MDIFGRSKLKQRKPRPGPAGIGFNLTSTGDFDIQAKKLRHVGEPEAVTDAVNLGTLTNRSLCLDGKNDFFDCKNKPLRHVGGAGSETDAITAGFFVEHALRKQLLNLNNEDGSLNKQLHVFNAKKMPIHEVGPPVTLESAISLQHLMSVLRIMNAALVHDIADLSIALRREMYQLKEKSKKGPKEMEKHLNDIESSVKKTWRQALEEPDSAKKAFSVQDLEKSGLLPHHYGSVFDTFTHFSTTE